MPVVYLVVVSSVRKTRLEGEWGDAVSYQVVWGGLFWAEAWRRQGSTIWVGGGSWHRCPLSCSVVAPTGAWYSVGALMISVPALLGYLQEVCRARLPESELVRRKYHSVRQEDLQRIRLSRPEAVAEVKSL